MSGLSKLTVAMLLSVAVGLHWTCLQFVAWAGMVVAFAQNEPLPVALSKTLGGEHPCAVCNWVKEGRSKEEQTPSADSKVKLDLLSVRSGLVLLAPALATDPHLETRRPTARSRPPPLPPPKSA